MEQNMELDLQWVSLEDKMPELELVKERFSSSP